MAPSGYNDGLISSGPGRIAEANPAASEAAQTTQPQKRESPGSSPAKPPEHRYPGSACPHPAEPAIGESHGHLTHKCETPPRRTAGSIVAAYGKPGQALDFSTVWPQPAFANHFSAACPLDLEVVDVADLRCDARLEPAKVSE